MNNGEIFGGDMREIQVDLATEMIFTSVVRGFGHGHVCRLLTQVQGWEL